jgi:hypothetical protein
MPYGSERVYKCQAFRTLQSRFLGEKYLNLNAYIVAMARVLDHLGMAKKHTLLHHSLRNGGKDLTMVELEVAREILAEVFAITTAEVDLMIKRRSEERMQWPERFWLEK